VRWLNFKLYGNISAEPKPLFSYTPTGKRNIELIERQVSRFYREHAERIHGIFVFRFWQDTDDAPPAEHDHAVIPERHYTELIRLRFRVDDSDYDWAFLTFRSEVIDALQKPSDSSLQGAPLVGWRAYEGYDAKGDVGARFGQPAHGADATEEIVEILTGWTKLRFYMLDHPNYAPNHDLINLYYNALGLTYPEELQDLQRRSESLRTHMSRAVGL
jgi:hypothetical protein